MTDFVADFSLEDDDINANFELDEGEVFNAILQLNIVGSAWGSISGDINNQTDLIELLDLKADKTEVESVTGALADSITAVSDNLQSEATTRADNDTILQNNINTVSNDLNAEIGNRASADTILQGNINALDDKIDSLTGALDDRIDTLSDTVTANYNTLDDKIDSINGALSDSISAEITNRQNADSIIGDSITALDNKFDSITGGLSDSIQAIDSTIGGYGDIVTYNAADFADSAQGALADTALQPNDNISELNNDAGYITSASLPTVNNSSIVFQKNGTNFDTITLNQSNNDTVNITVPTTAADVNALPDTTTINDLTTSTQQAALNSGANATNIGQIATNTQDISDEIINRQNADNGLQSQIDALVVASDVFDIVGTYAELQAYEIATVPVNDIIKVLVDSTHNDAATYYRCILSGGVKSWSYIGSEGAYYTKGEADGLFVPQTRTVNGKALSNNITLTASDVGALSDSTVIPTVNNSTITIQKNSSTVDTFTLNQATAKTINITVPTDTNDLTNGAGFITGINSSDVINALGYTPYSNANPDGFITGITSGDVTTALGYTPYNSSNPDGFITSADLPTNYVTTDTVQNITAEKTFVGNKLLKFKGVNGSSKLGFTAYDSNNHEVGYLEGAGNGNAAHTFRLGVYDTTNTNYDNKLGFEYYKAKGSDGVLHRYNLLAPPLYPSTTAQDFYIPMAITDGNTTVTADNTGTVNISSLIPTVPTNISAFTNDSGYITSSALSPYALSSSLATVATSGDYDDLLNKPTIPTVDQVYDSTSVNAQSGVAIAGALADYQPLLTSGTNIKTVNNTSLLGSGNIDTDNVYWATYGTTTFTDIMTAINAGKLVMCSETSGNIAVTFVYRSHTDTTITFYNVYGGGNTIVMVDSSNNWDLTDVSFLPDQTFDGTSTNAQSGVAIAGKLANYALTSSLATVATSGSYNDLTNTPTIPAAQVQADWDVTDTSSKAYIKNKPYIPSGVIIDQTYDGTSANAQSGVAIEGELTSNYQSKLVSGTDIKTINNTSILGSGNIDTSEIILIQESEASHYTYQEIYDLVWGSKPVYYYKESSNLFFPFIGFDSNNSIIFGLPNIYIATTGHNGFKYVYIDTNGAWHTGFDDIEVEISSKVSKSGDTMTGQLQLDTDNNTSIPLRINNVSTTQRDITFNATNHRVATIRSAVGSSNECYLLLGVNNTSDDAPSGLRLTRGTSGTAYIDQIPHVTTDIYVEKLNPAFVSQHTSFNYTSTSTPSSNILVGQYVVKDVNGKNVGGLNINHNTGNNVTNVLYARRSIGGEEKTAYLTIGVDSSGNPYATAPVTPAAGSNGTNIATTAFVHRASDGGWVALNQDLANGDLSLYNANGTPAYYTCNVPNDGNKYEVLVSAVGTTTSTNAQQMNLYIYSDLITNEICMFRNVCRSSVAFTAGGSATIALSTNRRLYVKRASNYYGTVNIYIKGYRRIGTNT